MLFHLSFAVRDPAKVGAFLSAVLGARIVRAPSPPFSADSLFVCCGDERGTMISLEPWGVTYRPGPKNMTAMPRGDDSPPHTPFHGLFLAKVGEAKILELAADAGWPAGRVPNGPFEVINVWLEGTQLIEFTTPELYPAYQAAFDAKGVETLDASNRALEARLRAMGMQPG